MGFSLRLAWREGRSSLGRIGVFMTSISLGVGALVAVHSFRADVDRSLAAEARTLLGADLRLESSLPFTPRMRALADSLAGTEGVDVAEVTTLASMIHAPRSGLTRLLQLQAVAGGYPFYVTPAAEPAGSWERLGPGVAVVDPAVLVQLDARVGDTLQVGERHLRIAGTVTGLPTELGFQSALGPRVHIAHEELAETGLVTFGSVARHRFLLRVEDGDGARRLRREHRETFRSEGVRVRTARQEAEDLSEAMGTLARFLSLVGLAALLLGGIGVASAVHVFVKDKLTSVAVLRCIGATQRAVFGAYLLQATALGLLGSAVGAALGVAAQALLPALLRDVLPVEVAFAANPGAIAAGFAIGVWIALVFALIPLLALLDVAPLRALRAGYEPERRRPRLSFVAAWLALGASLLLLSLRQAETPRAGLAFAGALAATLLVLWLVAEALMRGTRRFFPAGASFPVRQGVSNLFRPRNQSVAVTLALGFGAFIIGAVHVMERNLLRELDMDAGEERPNLLLFDIQPAQRAGVEALIREAGAGAVEVTPIVPARIAAIGERSVDELLSRQGEGGPPGWTLRRVYRHTYRAALTDAEIIVAGEWWDGRPGRPGRPRAPPGAETDADTDAAPRTDEEGAAAPARISVEEELARDLGVDLGDVITWDIQGVRLPTRVTSLRAVDWARFQSNFFVVFEPGVLDDAPQMAIALARVPDAERRAGLERDLVRGYSNVSVLDLELVQETVGRILGRITGAIRLLAGFILLAGLLVLFGTLTTTRFQRMRESALLKTLGAERRVLLAVLLSEYAALGALAGLAGFSLGAAAAWFLLTRDFGMGFELPLLPLAGLWVGFILLTVAVGLANGRAVLRGTPLEVLRESGE